MAGNTLAEGRAPHLPSRFGNLPPRWSWLRLDDACEGVFDCPHSTPKLVNSGPLIVRSQDIITGVLRAEQAACVSEETYKDRTSRVVPTRGDILYSREGTYFGIAAEVPEHTRLCLGQRMVLIRPKAGVIDFRFLCHWLNSPVMASHIHGYRDGSVAERLNLPTIRALPVLVPPLPEQRAIAHILGTLDNKIELNRRMNETLEAMARALFKSWFVDFDPVRAKHALSKVEGAEGCPSASSGQAFPGLPKPLADLFPDSFEDSEMGEIPMGWEVWRVADVGKVVCGKTPSTTVSEYYGDDIPFITIPDMHGKIFVTTTQKQLSCAGAASQQKQTLPVGAICVSCIATPGLVVITTEEAQTNQQINTVVPSRTDETYFWFWSFHNLGDEIRAGGSGGSVLTNLSTGRFAELRVLAPPAGLRCSYHSRVAHLFDRILSNENETITLAALRDTLLPKLISGELRIENAERFIGGGD